MHFPSDRKGVSFGQVHLSPSTTKGDSHEHRFSSRSTTVFFGQYSHWSSSMLKYWLSSKHLIHFIPMFKGALSGQTHF